MDNQEERSYTKKENKSQLFKRGLKSLETNAKVLVERVSVPLVLGYLHPISNKVVFMLDSVTKDIFNTSNVLEKIEGALYSSHKSGKPLELVFDNEEAVDHPAC